MLIKSEIWADQSLITALKEDMVIEEKLLELAVF